MNEDLSQAIIEDIQWEAMSGLEGWALTEAFMAHVCGPKTPPPPIPPRPPVDQDHKKHITNDGKQTR